MAERPSDMTVDFSGLVLGFSSAALHYLGEASLPEQGKVEKNLPLAKQNIDILSLLRDKTKGNLTDQEEKLIGQVLADLQMRYVSSIK